MARFIQSTNLDAIVVGAFTKDMSVRAGYESDDFSERITFQDFLILPTYISDCIYSNSPISPLFFVRNMLNYYVFQGDPSYDETAEYPPFMSLVSYPNVPIIRLMFLHRVNLLNYQWRFFGEGPEFHALIDQKRAENAPLSEILEYVGMEEIITTNNVFELMLRRGVLAIEGEVPTLPPPALDRLILDEERLTDVSTVDTYPVPAEFANDLRVIVNAYKGGETNLPSLFAPETSLGSKLALRLFPDFVPPE
jgi:hypothetical protein